jgi:VanZ family protein
VISVLKSLLLAIWAIAVLLMTCTTRFELENSQMLIYFSWTSHPELGDFFLGLPADLTDAFIFQKIGHIIAFTILAILLMTQTTTVKTLLFSISFALSTEILQLYVSRGGRLYDTGFDLIGIILGMSIAASSRAAIFKNQHTTLKR